MVYGKRFNGKSSVAMLLADVLVKNGLKVLYVSNEEGIKGSLQEKLLRLKISNPINFVEDYDSNQFRGYDAVFLDSTQTVGITPDEFKTLKKKYPNTSFILVFKANRDGTSKGGSDWEHDVDAIMHIENQSATMEKNRFPNGSNETIKIF
jgi:predicted ATP-dependent serine protease